MALRYKGNFYVEGTRDEILDLKNASNSTGSNPDLRSLAPGMSVQVSDASGGAVVLQAVLANQFAALGAQEDSGTPSNPWKRVTYDIETDTATPIS